MAEQPVDRHVFRFFADAPGEQGLLVDLSDTDSRHLQVLRLEAGSTVEVADGDGSLWQARVEDHRLRLVSRIATSSEEPVVELVAGALVGGRFDELVDGAVQAGATRIVPFAASRRDAERLGARRARLQRIAKAAAKQSKRSSVPEVVEPIDVATLLERVPGIVVDATAPRRLDDVAAAWRPDAPLTLLVGPAEGLDRTLVADLLDRGWTGARLGPSILRAELAAPVAVAIAAMVAPRRQAVPDVQHSDGSSR